MPGKTPDKNETIGDFESFFQQQLNGRTHAQESAGSEVKEPILLQTYRRALVQTAVRLAKAQHRIADDPTNLYVPVLGVLEVKDVPLTDPAEGHILRRARVMPACQVESVRERVGFIMHDPSEQTTLILFDDGSWANVQLNHLELLPLEQRSAVVALDARTVEVAIPLGANVQVGDTLKLDQQFHFAGIAEWSSDCGELASVEQVLSDSSCVVNVNGAQRVVQIHPAARPVKAGNRVVLDALGRTIRRNLGSTNVDFRYFKKPSIRWADIGGQEEAKAELRTAIETPLKYPQLMAQMKKRPAKGFLLFGPPGCGKNMTAEAVMSMYLDLHGPEAVDGIIYINAPDLLRSLVGEQEALLRYGFRLANLFEEQHGYSALIIINEVDGICKKRGLAISSDSSETLLQTALTQIDQTNAIVISMTNRQDILDPAFVRSKRVSRKIYVGRPDKATAKSIFGIYLKDIPTEGMTSEELAANATEELFSDTYAMYKLNVEGTDSSETVLFALRDIVSGAMIDDSIVEKAKDLAINRAIAGGTDAALRKDDIACAIRSVFETEVLVDHSDDTKRFAENLTGTVRSVDRLYQGKGKHA